MEMRSSVTSDGIDRVDSSAFRRTWVVASAVLLLATGCSREQLLPIDHDAAQAREALVTALDAWKGGRASKLTTKTPPLRFVDDDWIEGKALLSYELTNPAAKFLPYENIAVDLELRDRSGKTNRKSVVYQVTLKPSVAVLRADQ